MAYDLYDTNADAANNDAVVSGYTKVALWGVVCIGLGAGLFAIEHTATRIGGVGLFVLFIYLAGSLFLERRHAQIKEMRREDRRDVIEQTRFMQAQLALEKHAGKTGALQLTAPQDAPDGELLYPTEQGGYMTPSHADALGVPLAGVSTSTIEHEPASVQRLPKPATILTFAALL